MLRERRRREVGRERLSDYAFGDEKPYGSYVTPKRPESDDI
jgi:hypothetical protein